MKLSDQARISMLNAVFGTVTSEVHAPIHVSHVGYSEGVEALGETISALDQQIQAAQGNPGATTAKEQARLSLCVIGVEVIGAIKAYCAVAQDPEPVASWTTLSLVLSQASAAIVR